jgi:hypothetical protein
MESEHAFDGNKTQIIKKIKEGKIKPLTTNRPKKLIELYNSMRNIVCCLFFIFILLESSLRPDALNLLSHPLIYSTIITHKLPIPFCLEVLFFLYLFIYFCLYFFIRNIGELLSV